MFPAGIPDLLSSGRNARLIAEVQANFQRASDELTSGRKSDVVAATGGDPARLFGVERELTAVAQRRINVDIAISRASIIQSSLERVQTALERVGVPLLAAVERDDVGAALTEAETARSAFEEAVSALNSRFGDRTLFSGAATDGPALATGPDLLQQIFAATSAATDAASVIAAVDAYFSSPTGFAATGYLGSTTNASASEIDDGQREDFALRADNADLVSGLRALALAAVASEGAFAGANIGAQLDILRVAGESGIAATDRVINLRGLLGVSEERLDVAKTRLSGENAFLQQARNAIISKDQFEAANEFTALEGQLSLVFEVTARLSTLKLQNFLR